MRRLLICAALLVLFAVGLASRLPAHDASAPRRRAQPAPVAGSYVGKGFDACSAPPSAAMDAWLTSPYRAVGIYFGGSNRACTQPALTAHWVAHQLAAGWHIVPIYMGLQAPCTLSDKHHLIDPVRAAAQGRAEAESAVAAARGIGLPRSTVLIFDMEAYRTGDASCTRAVLTFLGGWTSRLHHSGYFSGVYASIGSGVTDLVKDYRSRTRPHPDYLDFARWDGEAATTNPAVPARCFSPHRRIHQYLGAHDETYGGVTINIDSDYVDIRTPPVAGFSHSTLNGARAGYGHRHPHPATGRHRTKFNGGDHRSRRRGR